MILIKFATKQGQVRPIEAKLYCTLNICANMDLSFNKEKDVLLRMTDRPTGHILDTLNQIFQPWPSIFYSKQ